MATWRSVAFAALLSTLLSTNVLAAIGPVADLHISNKVVAPDGVNRLASVVNGNVDTTLVTAKVGDTFQLNVINELSDALEYTDTSIHWHGISQQGTAWADGSASVTQCPVTPGSQFLYTFKAANSGTYWFHSHLSTQYCDGVRGPIVIYDDNDPYKSMYDVDNDSTVLTLADWYQIPFNTLRQQFPVNVPRSNSTLFNGVGRSIADLTAPLAVISVVKNKRYRFRLLNMACDPDFQFQIDGHTFTVIEADGILHQPVKNVDMIHIYPGQRYSFILNANQKIGNYWIRAAPNVAISTGFDNGLNSAILRYVGAPVADPTTNYTAPKNPLKETDLHVRPFTRTTTTADGKHKTLAVAKVPGKPVPGGVTKAFNLVTSFNFTDFRFYMNGATFTPPSMPVLLQILSGAQTAQSLLPQGSYYQIDQGDTVEISLPGYDIAGPHPFHLHGHSFWVVRSENTTEYNYVDPPYRDVVNTGTSADNVTIRFQVDNPGPWFLHCHIDLHLDIGLAIVLAESIPQVPSEPEPATWGELCPTYQKVHPTSK